MNGVVSGFSGGDEACPSYDEVKRQLTGHRETVCIKYDPDIISYGALLDIFLAGVDPYDGEGQYIDRGRSYTLAVYYCSDEERALALGKIKELKESSGRDVFIEVEPFRSFYPAGEEHQDYYLKNPEAFEKELIESGRKKDRL